jgi:hypothetical protein
MSTMMGWMRGLALATVVASTGACGQLGSVGDVLGGVLGTGNANASEVAGEIRTVDTRNQVLQVRMSDGRTASVMFDGNTRVVYQNQEYGVGSLEPGDGVQMRLQQDANGRLYTDYIAVTYDGSPNDNGNTGGVGGLFSLSGSVGAVDRNRGTFELRQQGGGSYLVALPYNPTSTTRNRFQSLRTGDWVNLSARQVSETRFELESFR